MGSDEGLPLIAGMIMSFIAGGFLAMVIAVSVWVPHARQQERACYPGAFVETTRTGGVVCAGGRGETWVVRP